MLKLLICAYILLLDICRAAEVIHDLRTTQIEKLLLENFRIGQPRTCEATKNYYDLINSYTQCKSEQIILQNEEKSMFKQTPELRSNKKSSGDAEVVMKMVGSKLAESTIFLASILQEVSSGLYAAIGHNECERSSLSGADDLKTKSQEWGCYLKKSARDATARAVPHAKSFAESFKKTTRGLLGSMFGNECEWPARHTENNLIVRSFCLSKIAASQLWWTATGFGSTIKEHIEDTRIYTYFYGRKKKWYEKLTDPVVNIFAAIF